MMNRLLHKCVNKSTTAQELSEVIQYNLKKFKELRLDNPLQEIRYIIHETIGISLEDQIFKKELVINKSQVLELEKIFEERMQSINWNEYCNDIPFNQSALSLYEWAPIAEELKSLDRKNVLNSVILKWDIIKKEFKERIKF